MLRRFASVVLFFLYECYAIISEGIPSFTILRARKTYFSSVKDESVFPTHVTKCDLGYKDVAQSWRAHLACTGTCIYYSELKETQAILTVVSNWLAVL